MAGLAAALNAPSSIDAIAWALAARGPDGAVCRLTGPNGVCLDLAVRAAMPAITKVVAAPADPPAHADPDSADSAASDDSPTSADAADSVAPADSGAGDRGEAAPGEDAADEEAEHPVAAIIVDGVASVTALDRGYLERGPAGLVDGGEHPYAVVLADAERGELVLARNGTGPTLYYARLDDGWVVASEPRALIHAGVAPEPDVGVIRRFVKSGTCDDSDRTFFAKIRRLLPGEAIVLSTAVSGPVRHPVRHTPPAPPSVDEAIWRAGAGERVGVLLTPGVGGAAVLGAALHQPGRTGPLSVFTATMPALAGPAAQVPDVLRSLPPSAVRHTPVTARLDLSTLDAFLADLGEPVPDLSVYLLWTVARELSGGIGTLVDATPGTLAARERIADRMLAHYGVAVPAPLRGDDADEQTLAAILRRVLPPQVARLAHDDAAALPTSAQVVLALRDEVAAALVPPRPWSDASASVTALRRLQAGEDVDADALLRAFLVERWLAGLGPQVKVPDPALVRPTTELPEVPVREPGDVVVDGGVWRRTLVRTAPIAAGDPLLANAAFYVTNLLTTRGDLPLGPWFVVISGKAVAVSQDRVEPVDWVRPGRLAAILARLARRHRPHLAEPATMRVAIDHCGLWPIVGTVLFGRPLPSEAANYPPRPGAVAPANAAVVRPPSEPDEVAASLVAALRLALTREHWRTLAGVAIASADDAGCRVLGFAPGPAAEATPHPRTLLSMALADNPAGQGTQRTPIVIVAQQTVATVERALHATEAPVGAVAAQR
jgi:hypothetical protein